MGLFKRAKHIAQAKVSGRVEKSSSVVDELDYAMEKQNVLINDVRNSLVTLTATRKALQDEGNALVAEHARLKEQAQSALRLGDEPLARELLSRRSMVEANIRELEVQVADLLGQESRLEQALGQLEGRMSQFARRKESAKAAYRVAEAEVAVREVSAGLDGEMTDAGYLAARAEDQVQEMVARSLALEELSASGALLDSSEVADPSMLAGTDVDATLAKMRAELSGPPAE